MKMRHPRCCVRAQAPKGLPALRGGQGVVGMVGMVGVLGLISALAAGPVQAQDAARVVYRCPGPPVLYTDAITAAEAKSRNCRTIEGAPVTVVHPARRKPADAPAAGAAAAGAAPATPSTTAAAATPAPRSPEARVDPAAQRARDTDSRRILEQELRREEESLVNLKREFNNGEPERRGDERNFARYQERVAEMRAAIARKEADIAAIKRELAKLPG